MQGTIRIVQHPKLIKVYFTYNSDLVEIMQIHKGWWHGKEKSWSFPLFKLKEIRDELEQKMYQVSVTKVNWQS